MDPEFWKCSPSNESAVQTGLVKPNCLPVGGMRTDFTKPTHVPGQVFRTDGRGPISFWSNSGRGKDKPTNLRPNHGPGLAVYPSSETDATRLSYVPGTLQPINFVKHYPSLRQIGSTEATKQTRSMNTRINSRNRRSTVSMGANHNALSQFTPIRSNLNGKAPDEEKELKMNAKQLRKGDRVLNPREVGSSIQDKSVNQTKKRNLDMLLKTQNHEVESLNKQSQELKLRNLESLNEMPPRKKYSKEDLDILLKSTKKQTKVKKTKKVRIVQYEEKSRNFKPESKIFLESIQPEERQYFDNQHEIQQETEEYTYDFESEEDIEDIEDSTNIKILLEEIDLSEEIKKSIAHNVEHIVQSENILEMGAKKFYCQSDSILEEFVQAAFEESLCCRCEKEALVSCDECGILCTEHDIIIHTEQPLHIRYAGTLKLETGVTLDKSEKHLISFPVMLPVRVTKKCECGTMMVKKCSVLEPVKCLDTSGSFEAKFVEFNCGACLSLMTCSVKDYFSSKLFPLDCTEDAKLFVSFRLLDLWKKLKNNCPSLTQGTFLKSITMTSLIEVKQSEFDQAYQEFNHLQFKLGKRLGEAYNDCPAKQSKVTRVHTDGNSKLSRFVSKFQRKSMKFSYYADEVVMNDDFVKGEIMKYRNHKMVSSKMGDAACGESHWKAAENKTTHSSILDEKGINFTVCSHYVIVLAVNQPFGEIYALHNVGIANIANRGYNIGDVALDVACKYNSWNERLLKNDKLLRSLTLAPSNAPVWIGDVHSKGHSTWCRILFGHVYNGIGQGSAGEQVEVMNSPLSQLKYRTRFMGTKRRNDEITEFILYRNKETDENIVNNILKTLARFEKESDHLKRELAYLEEKNSFIIDDIKIEVIKNAARKVLSANKEDIESKIEVLAASVIQKRNQFRSTVDTAMKSKVKLNLQSATNKLNQTIDKYNDEKNVQISMENALLGIFPWNIPHLPQEMQKDPVTFLKAAEMFLKLKRTKEEIPILIDDIKIILKKRVNDIESLCRNSEDSLEWQKARFLKSALLKEQLSSEIQLIRSAPHLKIPTDDMNLYIGEGRPLFRCTKVDVRLDELIEVVEDE